MRRSIRTTLRITFAVAVVLSLTACADQHAYRIATEEERVGVVAAVRDYYTLRDRLMTGLAIEDFWRAYPELSYEHDLGRGINLEVMLWKWSHDPGVTRFNYRIDLESYQPIRVFVRSNEAIAMIHGLETYEPGRAGSVPTSGEVAAVLTLRLAAASWTVVRTDEQMLGERQPTEPPVR